MLHRPTLSLALSVVLAVTASTAAAQDTRQAADDLARRIRATQTADGLYGGDLATTCRVLDALGRSPRRYTDIDGPFVRRAAAAVVAGRATLDDDALLVLALAGAITAPNVAAREAALAAVLASEGPAGGAALLVRATYAPEAPRPVPLDPDDAMQACLAAADPSTVAPPPVEDVAAWTAWARAARLRGLVPDARPVLPEPGPDAELPELLAALETVLALHGLPAQGPAAPTAETAPPPPRVDAGGDLRPALERAAAFLADHQRDGTFGLEMQGWAGPEPGITALNLAAACWLHDELGTPRPDWIEAGLDFLVGLQKDDGAIAAHGLDVYTTSVAIEALIAGGREADRPVIERARGFLVAAQADEGEGYSLEEDAYYGGIGYGGDERPDLSNTQMALDALAAAGTPADAEVYRKAMVFLQRCQNLGEVSVQAWDRPGGGKVISGTDGGAVYMPGNSPAGEDPAGDDTWIARSYGSMTYGLVKSYLFCDVSPDDPRVQAAVRWLGRNFTVDRNPGFADADEAAQGLYYYYLAMARTLSMLPDGSLVDAEGDAVRWREALRRKLLDEQRTDGSWLNERAARWWEGAPTLCTAYAILSLKAVGGA